jgi:hypothetical protein
LNGKEAASETTVSARRLTLGADHRYVDHQQGIHWD